MADDVRIVDDRHDSAIAAPLVHALGREVEVRYGAPDHEPDPISTETFTTAGGGAFYVAWRGDDAVGCGALRRYDETTGEVKRMYVRPDARNTGVARVVLREIERRAAELGYGRLMLETGTMQPEAIALYESEGWVLIEPYGFYEDSPLSRCFAKQLS